MCSSDPLDHPSVCIGLHWFNVDHCHLPANGEAVQVRFMQCGMPRTAFVEFWNGNWMLQNGSDYIENVTHYAYVHGPDNLRLK